MGARKCGRKDLLAVLASKRVNSSNERWGFHTPSSLHRIISRLASKLVKVNLNKEKANEFGN